MRGVQLNAAVVELTQQVKPWGILDVRALTISALKQGLVFYSFDEVHFYAIMYEQSNDLLLNILCDENSTFVAGQETVTSKAASQRPKRHGAA